MTAKFAPAGGKGALRLLRPVIHCDRRSPSPTRSMFLTIVVQCPQEQMIEKIGQTLVASAITGNKTWERQLIDPQH